MEYLVYTIVSRYDFNFLMISLVDFLPRLTKYVWKRFISYCSSNLKIFPFVCCRQLFLCVGVGLWAGLVIGFVTEYFTSNAYR